MTYVLIEPPFNILDPADAYRLNVKGYTGNIYSITDANGGTSHTEEWITKHSLTTKTTLQAQAIVDSAIAEYNNDLPLIGSRNEEPQSSVTLE